MLQEDLLKDIKVVEFCHIAAGPFCGMLLADMGADVIKIEHPDVGDSLRTWAPINKGFSENFASLNRNKRSVALDLKNNKDLEKAKKLISQADILIENNRPGVMTRLGLGYSEISKINRKLVYCSISAYGQSGPRSQEGGFDLTLQAMSGLMSVTGEPGGAPVKCGVPVCDFAAGLYAALSIVAALHRVTDTDVGAHIDISMLGATLGIAALQISQYFGTGVDPIKLGSAHPRNAPYQVFRCKGGYFGMAAGNDLLWETVCRVIKREELTKDDRFLTTSTRAENQDILRHILEEEFLTANRQVWLEKFRKAGVPCAPVNNYSEILYDEQVKHMEWVQLMKLPNDVDTKTFGSPIRINGRTMPLLRRPPMLGEHNTDFFNEIGKN